MKGGGLQLSRLINDDYFEAIKITFNAKLHVSAMKLLLSAIGPHSLARSPCGTVHPQGWRKAIQRKSAERTTYGSALSKKTNTLVRAAR